MDISRFSKTYDSDNGPIQVFEDADALQIERGDKIALIGKNGAGKSTLARILLGTEPFEGTRKEGHNVEMTFFAQHQAETLDRSQTALDALRSVAVGRSETELRTLLGAFLFRGDDVFKTVSVLSGGERSRVALARTLASPANLLILDEPTNHLDIQSIGVLTEALRQYSGTFVLVSHDRHFLDRVVNKVLRVEDGHVEAYEGNFSDYLWQAEHGTRSKKAAIAPSPGNTKAADSPTSPSSSNASGPKSKEQKRQEAKEREKLRQQKIAASGSRAAGLNNYQLKIEYSKVEAKVETMEEKKAALEIQLADPGVFADPSKGKALMAEFDQIQEELGKLNKDWEDLASEMSERDLD